MFGINGSEFIVLLAVAAVVLGPERLPQYSQQLARLIKELRRMAAGASAQVREEMGPEFDDIDWRKLDPRQYDPRRIVREALADTIDMDDPVGWKAAQRERAAAEPGEKPVSAGGPEQTTPAGAGQVPVAAGGDSFGYLPRPDATADGGPAAQAAAEAGFDLDAT